MTVTPNSSTKNRRILQILSPPNKLLISISSIVKTQSCFQTLTVRMCHSIVLSLTSRLLMEAFLSQIEEGKAFFIRALKNRIESKDRSITCYQQTKASISNQK